MIPSFLIAGGIKILGSVVALGLSILIVSAVIHTLNKRILMFWLLIAIGGFAYAIFST